MGCNTFNYNLNHNGYPYKTISVKAFNWYFIRKELCEAEEEGIRYTDRHCCICFIMRVLYHIHFKITKLYTLYVLNN